jgi:hypothetical protein
MYTDHPITIVLVNDEHFMPMAAALLKSIQINHISGEPIEVFMVSDGISNTSKKSWKKVLSGRGSVFSGGILAKPFLQMSNYRLIKPLSLLQYMHDTLWHITCLKTENVRCF